jgi:multidrug efflux pump subunit AcrB
MNNYNERNDWNYRLVRYFLNNRHLTILGLLTIVIVGFFSFRSLQVQSFPEVQIPVAVVNTVVPGASPETIDQTVTVPLEEKIREVKSVSQVMSTSQSSVSMIIVNFREGADVSKGVQDIRTKIASVTLPESATDPDITIPEFNNAPYVVAVTGNKSLTDLLNLSGPLKEELTALKGVQSVELFSNLAQNIYIDIEPQFMSPEVVAQIQSANIAFPLGQAVINGNNTPIAGSALVKSIEDIKAIPITVAGNSVKLDDIANIYEAVDFKNTIHRVGYRDKEGDQTIFRIQSAALYSVRLNQGTDILGFDGSFQDTLKRAQEKVGNQADYVLVYNEAESSRQQVQEIVEGAVGGKWDLDGPLAYLGYIFGAIWLLLIMSLLFLDWRSAIISVLSIPLSFLFTFIFLRFLDIQLNTLVLFSLVLVLGLVVDPAIVVLESIKRYMELGYKNDDAVLRSVKRIGLGIFIAVLTSLVVFLPFALVSGTFGEIIKYIPLTVIPALLASYFIPMLFLTWFASRFLKAKEHGYIINEDNPDALWPISRWFIAANRYILQRRWLQVLVVVLGLVIPVAVTAALFATGQVRQVQFAGVPDSDYITVAVPVQNNATNDQLVAQNNALENVLKDHVAEIRNYYYLSFNPGSTDLSVFIQLLPGAEREKTSKEIVKDLQNQLLPIFGEKVLASELSSGPPTGAYPVVLKIFENDKEKLLTSAKSIAEELKSYEEVSAVAYDGEQTSSNISLQLDPAKLGEFGLSPAAVYPQVASLFGEKKLFNLGDREVVLRVATASRPDSKEDLEGLRVFGSKGPVALSSIGTLSDEQAPGAIKRLNGERYAEVQGRVKDERDIIAVQRKIKDWAQENTEELGLTARSFEDRAGVDEFEKSFQELFAAIAISILITYLIFVLFFKSFIQPFIILFSIPLIMLGVFPGLVLFASGQFGFLEIIGIIMVIGIAENVGIFLIDYANQKVAEGMDKKEAIAISSGIRLRPIVLTKVTALAGLLPLAIFAPFWRGLAVVVIAGILTSGVLSLFTTPVLYSWFTRTKKINRPETYEA